MSDYTKLSREEFAKRAQLFDFSTIISKESKAFKQDDVIYEWDILDKKMEDDANNNISSTASNSVLGFFEASLVKLGLLKNESSIENKDLNEND